MVRTSPYMRVRSGTRYVNLDKYLLTKHEVT